MPSVSPRPPAAHATGRRLGAALVVGLWGLAAWLAVLTVDPAKGDDSALADGSRPRATVRRAVAPAQPPRPGVAVFSSRYGMGAETIELDDQGGYRRDVSGCTSEARVEGRYELADGVLTLEPPEGELPADPYGESYPLRLHELRWGPRRYLLRDWQVRQFCQAVNEGSETSERSSGFFLLPSGHGDLSAPGAPDVPPPWDELLLAEPLLGRALEPIGTHGAWADLGRQDGARVGMHLFVEGVPLRESSRHLFGGRAVLTRECEVVEVEARRCRLADVQRRQAETMLGPVPIDSVVTSLRPPGL